MYTSFRLSFLLVLFLFSVSSFAGQKVAAGNLIVKLKNQAYSLKSLQETLDYHGLNVEEPLIEEMGIFLLKTPPGIMASDIIDVLRKSGIFEYVQYDHLVTKRATPNDESFNDMWNFVTQDNGADINALAAWDKTTGGTDARGNKIVVAVVDGGVDLSHPDLAANIWVNENEIPGNGVDDDENGYIDDVNGWNIYSSNGSIPVARHGTHVAGIVGAKGNNQTGVVGVNWDVSIMAIAGSSGSTSTVLKSYGYVLKQKKLWLETDGKKGANVVVTNSSFGVDYAKCNTGSYPAWNDIYNEMGKAGILSAAATINGNVDVDKKGDVPTGCSSPYIVAVTNTDSTNKKYDSAGYGKESIDLGAPGTNIFSTVLNESYGTLTGTSMATPHVAGAIALLHAAASSRLNSLYYQDPGQFALEIKQALLNSVTPNDSLKSGTVSGGKLNLEAAVLQVK